MVLSQDPRESGLCMSLRADLVVGERVFEVAEDPVLVVDDQDPEFPLGGE